MWTATRTPNEDDTPPCGVTNAYTSFLASLDSATHIFIFRGGWDMSLYVVLGDGAADAFRKWESEDMRRRIYADSKGRRNKIHNERRLRHSIRCGSRAHTTHNKRKFFGVKKIEWVVHEVYIHSSFHSVRVLHFGEGIFHGVHDPSGSK